MLAGLRMRSSSLQDHKLTPHQLGTLNGCADDDNAEITSIGLLHRSSLGIIHGSRPECLPHWEEQACAAPWEEQTMDDMEAKARKGKDHAPLFKCMPACRWRGKQSIPPPLPLQILQCMCGMPSSTGRPSCMHRIHHAILLRPFSSLDASVSEYSLCP